MINLIKGKIRFGTLSRGTVVFREIETVFGLVRIPVLFVPNKRS